MKRARVFHDKSLLPDGSIVEMTIWRLPVIDSERSHGLKYSLFYGWPGERSVGYDNEHGKGDHRHIQGRELHYHFVSVEQLIADFLTDVEQARAAGREPKE